MSDGEPPEHPKGILKHVTEGKKTKTFQWDEMNILATFHPADKDYGHMHIDEPDTPYNFEYNPNDPSVTDGQAVSPEALASMLEKVSGSAPKMLEDPSGSSVEQLTPEEAKHRRDFEAKRKAHYNEYQTVQQIRHKHPSESEDDTDEEMDPVALRNAQLNAQLGKLPPPPSPGEKGQSK
ncbi:hypothetical protein AAHC03_025955 [Spirometra sp. Aus1]